MNATDEYIFYQCLTPDMNQHLQNSAGDKILTFMNLLCEHPTSRNHQITEVGKRKTAKISKDFFHKYTSSRVPQIVIKIHI